LTAKVDVRVRAEQCDDHKRQCEGEGGTVLTAKVDVRVRAEQCDDHKRQCEGEGEGGTVLSVKALCG
jgi:hypothetical protein